MKLYEWQFNKQIIWHWDTPSTVNGFYQVTATWLSCFQVSAKVYWSLTQVVRLTGFNARRKVCLTYLHLHGRTRILFFTWLSLWTEHLVTEHSLSTCMEVRLENLPYIMLERWWFHLKSSTSCRCPCSWKTISFPADMVGSREDEY